MYTNCSFGTWVPGRYTEVAFIQGWLLRGVPRRSSAVNQGSYASRRSRRRDTVKLASIPGRLKYGLVSIAWVIVRMR